MEKNNKTKLTNMERIDKASLLKVISKASVKFEGDFYHIKKHTDLTVLIYDKNDKVIYEPVLPFLRKINSSNNLDVDLSHSSGHIKNTRVLGKDIINQLNG